MLLAVKPPNNGFPKEKVFVVSGGDFVRKVRDMFTSSGYEQANSFEEADIHVWCGGADVDPEYYDQVPIDGTQFDTGLDLAHINAYNRSMQCKNVIRVGICRGGQLLNILNGGSMWQNIDNHNDGGLHLSHDIKTGRPVTLNSLHHQQMIPNKAGIILTTTSVASVKENAFAKWKLGDTPDPDVEAVWFPGTSSLCFQPHPEFAHKETREYFFELINRYAVPF